MFYILCFQLWCLSSFWICLSWWAHYVIWRHKKCLYDAHAATRSLSFQSVIFYVWSSSSKEKSTCAIRGLSSSSVMSLRKRITFSWHLSQSQHTVELNFWKYSRNQARINGPRFLELIINSISWTPSLQIFCNFEAISWYFPSFLSLYLQSYFSLRIAKFMLFQVQFFWSTTNQICSPGFYHMFIPNNEIP